LPGASRARIERSAGIFGGVQIEVTWARLLKKIFEVDPLICRCGACMQIVSLITDPRIADRILRHRESARSKAQDPFEPRAPPRQPTATLQ
jgi:hypothetical protein